MNRKVLEALEYINVQELHYFEWINIGMALKTEGFDCSVWDNWAKTILDTKREPAKRSCGQEGKGRTYKSHCSLFEGRT